MSFSRIAVAAIATVALTGSALAQSTTEERKPEQYVATARQPSQESQRQPVAASSRPVRDETQARREAAQQEDARQEFLKSVWTAP